MILAAWLHNLSPVIVDLGPFPLRWYGLSYLAGFVVAFFIVRHICRVGVSTLRPERAADLVVSVAIGIFVGGRLGYVLFYDLPAIWEFTGELPFWGVLAINKGGMASHGGMIGGMVGCLYYARRHQHNALHLVDLFAFSAPIGVFFGRIANFINGELLGRPCDPSYPLAVKFPQELFDAPPEKLHEVYTALPSPGSVAPGLHYWDAVSVIELIQRGNAVVYNAVEPLLTPRHPSQLYAGISEGLIVLSALAIIWVKPRKPGMIAGTFAMIYALMRIGNEFFRMPDAHLIDREFASLHITRGQWLSVLLFLFGVLVLFYAQRKPVEPMGGWRRVKEDAG